MKAVFMSLLFCVGITGTNLAWGQCSPPTGASVTSRTSTCVNNGGILIRNVAGGGSAGALKEYAITASSNSSQPLIGYQNDSTFNDLYPGTYTVSIRYNCTGTVSAALTRSITVTGNYQTLNATFTNIKTSFCTNGGFTVTASNGYAGQTGTYSYQLVSTQGASQPDPNAVSAVQTNRVFSGLAAGTYYVRIFDDCGNFITRSVTVPSGTVQNPFRTSPYCPGNVSYYSNVNVFLKQQYDCADSTRYILQPTQFSYNVTTLTSIAFPAKLVLVYPNNTADTVVITSAFTWSTLGNKDITTFIKNGQTGPFYAQMIDNCGNLFESYKAYYAEPVKVYSGNVSTTTNCGTVDMKYNSFSNYNCTTTCPTLLSGKSWSVPSAYTYFGDFQVSLDNGATWYPKDHAFQINCLNTTQTFRPRFVACGDTITACQTNSIFSCPFSFPPKEINSFACNGKSGIFLTTAFGSSNANAIKVRFTSIPAGQTPIPVLDVNKIASGNVNYGDKNYLFNLVPGKYVYTVTDTVCNRTYTDSITLTHPHSYTLSLATTQTCTNANVTATVRHNSYFNLNGQPVSTLGYRNRYVFKLVSASGTVLQTQTVTAPTNTPPDDGSTQAGSVTFTNVPVGIYAVRLYHDSTTYTMLTNPCGPVVDSIRVTEQSLDVASSLFIQCSGTAASIVAQAIGGVGPYTYELYQGTVAPGNLVATQSTPTFNGLNAQQSYTVRVIDACGSGKSVGKSFAPYAVVIKEIGAACVGQNLTLRADSVAGATYSWTKNGTTLSTTTNSLSFTPLTAADYGAYAVTVTFSGCAGFTGTRTIDANSCKGALPVTLSRFDVSAAERKALLTWTTESERNAAYFDILRSLNSREWAAVGRVAAHGTTTQRQEYAFTDAAPAGGANYYRLLQVDTDGSAQFGPVRSVVFEESKVQVSPNPFTSVLYIRGTNLQTATIVTLDGKEIGRYPVKDSGLDVRALAPGWYLVVVSAVNGERQSFRVLKEGR
jgi:uncharacterized protein (DUF2141 family)